MLEKMTCISICNFRQVQNFVRTYSRHGVRTKRKALTYEESSSIVTMPISSNFEDVGSFNHPHLSIKDRREKL